LRAGEDDDRGEKKKKRKKKRKGRGRQTRGGVDLALLQKFITLRAGTVLSWCGERKKKGEKGKKKEEEEKR